MNNSDKRKLVEPQSTKNGAVKNWLSEKGLVTWKACDVSHAIEELSDFTVRNRPDVVILEASPIFECLDALRSNLCDIADENDVSVLALCDGSLPTRSDPFFATNFDQLKNIMDREVARNAARV